MINLLGFANILTSNKPPSQRYGAPRGLLDPLHGSKNRFAVRNVFTSSFDFRLPARLSQRLGWRG